MTASRATTWPPSTGSSTRWAREPIASHSSRATAPRSIRPSSTRSWRVRRRAGSVLVVPDRHGTGTNALVLTPPGALAPSFGPGSCQRHLEHARAAGIHGELVDVPTLALDVDTSEDLDALAQRLAGIRGGAAHTRGMLLQLARSRGQ